MNDEELPMLRSSHETSMPTKVRSLAAALAVLVAAPVDAASVLMISVDGMNPEYVTEGVERGIDTPNMQRFMAEGSYASGVTGVVPTVSWPSAATLMTGVKPARHGVLNNNRFVPPDRNRSGGVYFFASDIKVDTLWDAAKRAGLTVANVDQLGSVGITSIDYDIPRFEPFSTWLENRKAIDATTRPPGLLPALEAKLGEYVGVDFDHPEYDRSRARFAIEIMKTYRPQFMSLHLSGVDVEAHANGPYSPGAVAAAENIDGLIGELSAAAVEADPEAVVVIVSDHGQLPATRQFHIRVPFVEAGLIEIAPPESGRPVRVTDWQATIWGNAIMLKDPTDAAVKTKVRELLGRLAADPANGIVRVVEEPELTALGGFPGASFLLEMQDGTVLGGSLTGAALTELPSTVGIHGELPSNPGMNSAFFIAGRGIESKRNLGQIDMRRIAPTVARVLAIELKDATEPVLPVFAGEASIAVGASE